MFHENNINIEYWSQVTVVIYIQFIWYIQLKKIKVFFLQDESNLFNEAEAAKIHLLIQGPLYEIYQGNFNESQLTIKLHGIQLRFLFYKY